MNQFRHFHTLSVSVSYLYVLSTLLINKYTVNSNFRRIPYRL